MACNVQPTHAVNLLHVHLSFSSGLACTCLHVSLLAHRTQGHGVLRLLVACCAGATLSRNSLRLLNCASNERTACINTRYCSLFTIASRAMDTNVQPTCARFNRRMHPSRNRWPAAGLPNFSSAKHSCSECADGADRTGALGLLVAGGCAWAASVPINSHVVRAAVHSRSGFVRKHHSSGPN